MPREIEVERTARILKQADPGQLPLPQLKPFGPSPIRSDPQTIVAVVAGIVAFIALLVSVFGR